MPLALIAIGTLNDHEAFDSVGNAQNAIQLCDAFRICVEIDEGVITVGQAVYLVSEFTLTPVGRRCRPYRYLQ